MFLLIKKFICTQGCSCVPLFLIHSIYLFRGILLTSFLSIADVRGPTLSPVQTPKQIDSIWYNSKHLICWEKTYDTDQHILKEAYRTSSTACLNNTLKHFLTYSIEHFSTQFIYQWEKAKAFQSLFIATSGFGFLLIRQITNMQSSTQSQSSKPNQCIHYNVLLTVLKINWMTDISNTQNGSGSSPG